MFVYLLITLPVFCFLWFVYTSRNVLLSLARWVLAYRYAVTLECDAPLDPRTNYLILPNHPAGIDPLILVLELHRQGIDVCPLVDESFFTIRIVRHVLSLFEAIRVPDFRHENFWPRPKYNMPRQASARRARALTYSVLALLTAGQNILLYPSGHITADGSERLGNRRLAHAVIGQLPDDVEVLRVRIRGLYGSMFSRAGMTHSPHYLRVFFKAIVSWPFAFMRPRRAVRIYIEHATDEVRAWSKGTRKSFDAQLERWYDADLARKGLTREPVT